MSSNRHAASSYDSSLRIFCYTPSYNQRNTIVEQGITIQRVRRRAVRVRFCKQLFQLSFPLDGGAGRLYILFEMDEKLQPADRLVSLTQRLRAFEQRLAGITEQLMALRYEEAELKTQRQRVLDEIDGVTHEMRGVVEGEVIVSDTDVDQPIVDYDFPLGTGLLTSSGVHLIMESASRSGRPIDPQTVQLLHALGRFREISVRDLSRRVFKRDSLSLRNRTRARLSYLLKVHLVVQHNGLWSLTSEGWSKLRELRGAFAQRPSDLRTGDRAIEVDSTGRHDEHAPATRGKETERGTS